MKHLKYIPRHCAICGWKDGLRSDLVDTGDLRFHCDKCCEWTTWEPDKIHGFRWKQLPTGERAPDCAWIIRFFMHYFWLWLFHTTPLQWQLERSGKLRNKIGIAILQSFAWWAYQHQKYRGYSKQWWEQCQQ